MQNERIVVALDFGKLRIRLAMLDGPILGLLSQLSRFLQVGAVGLCIDAGLLWLFVYGLELDPIAGRVLSFLATITVTYALNARYTFNVAPRKAQMPRYGVIQSLGALINFGSYTWLVTFWVLEPMISLLIGAALGSTHNFLMMRSFVFKDADPRKAN